jgi:hypothetical protein
MGLPPVFVTENLKECSIHNRGAVWVEMNLSTPKRCELCHHSEPMIVQKAFKYRFFPTDSQKQQLTQTFGCARVVWNWGLEFRSQTYEEEKRSLSYAALCSALAELKKTPAKASLNEVSSVVLRVSHWFDPLVSTQVLAAIIQLVAR